MLSYAKGLFENGFEKYDSHEFVAFSKYTNSLGWNRDKIEKEIIKRCSEKDGYNLVMNYQTISNSLKARKYNLLNDVESIWITDKEIEFFKNIQFEKYSKILFYVLVIARRDNPGVFEKLYYNYSINDAIKNSGVNFSELERENFNSWAGVNGYLLTTRSNSLTGKISWLIGYSNNGENSVHIVDFKKIMSYFPRYCKQCGKILEEKKKHGMCDECYNEYCRVNQAKYDKKYKKY